MIGLSLGQPCVAGAASFVVRSTLNSTFPFASLPSRPTASYSASASLLRSLSAPHSHTNPQHPPDDAQLDDLRVPPHWLLPSTAFQESEWLRVTLGEILLRMARELESISYQESFHGAFSSANAAVNLIAQRIEEFCQST